ncbi:UDP-2,3-diacylglucosamine hydrolase [Thalassospira lucentensis]|uniref:UDP-2,3-diacylglucosamine hydrolase n=3 Tax=Thalassospira TaxID=168934 RepID=A0A154L7Y3_9PROT|nr:MULTISPECIES: UDP-2,3-diacylglucosamine diphosphatase [Thalassospira]UKV15297.1 UDP-2,3-diacylglucosamine diphosphatase [Thalassospiraceae bacterium SW-3-3]AJD50747.1 Metallophosphoesterase [Thalassospira xiamenensis M-5 = DSM 17429]KZB66349.1 UDP-2,3-diacylglucosamine hydrolase [Thalassospira lucentensis]MAZ32955.1 UDP-2,3-diacylglucosamine diphosphatase [Thalassospira sp.]MBO9507661.1 UDP-2,3-diacylglucosamine diphosphatase [Thalassospira sp. A3_1]
MTAMTLQPHYRTVWISDVHLGTRGCQADLLLDFLNEVTADTYYLVGDIIDGWRLKKSWYWPESHHAVITTIMDKAKNGAKVIFVPGNHDEFAREFVDMTFGHVEVKMNDIHETADGRKLLIIHGDEFDGVVKYAKWLAYLGDTAYNLAIVLNRYYNGIRRRLGYGYWSLSAYLKNRVKNAVQFVCNFENAVAHEAAKRKVDGVVCGHIHHAEKRMIGDVLYCNDGDWVESCTALVEDKTGKLELLYWADMRQMAMTHSQPGRDAASAPSLGLGKLMSLFRIAGESTRTASRSSKKNSGTPIGKTA